MRDLTRNRIEFLIADEFYLNRMKVSSGRLLVREPFEFRTVILPPLFVLSLDAAEKLAAFCASGGTVIALGDLPAGSSDNGLGDPEMKRIMDRLRRSPGFHECGDGIESFLKSSTDGLESAVRFVSGGFDMLQHHREIDGRDFFWLANNTGVAATVEVHSARARGIGFDLGLRDRSHPKHPLGFGLRRSARVPRVRRPGGVLARGGSIGAVRGSGEGRRRISSPDDDLDGRWFVRVDMDIQTKQEHPIGPPPRLLEGRTLPLETWEKWGMKTFSGFVDYEKDVQLSPRKTAG